MKLNSLVPTARMILIDVGRNDSDNINIYHTCMCPEIDGQYKACSSVADLSKHDTLNQRRINVGLTIVDLVIFACLNFREFLILGLFTKFRIRKIFYFL